MDDLKKTAGEITGIHVEAVDLGEPFIDVSARFASMAGTVVLMSGGDLDCAQYHILGMRPWLVLSGIGRHLSITCNGKTFHVQADPFDTLRMVLRSFNLDGLDLVMEKLPKPIVSGLLGYLSYDLKDSLEKLPRTSIDRLRLPHLYFTAPSIIVVHDKVSNNTHLCITQRSGADRGQVDIDIAFFKQTLAAKKPMHGSFSGDPGGFKSNFIKSNYIDAIEKIKAYIVAGDIYQVNMSQRFEMAFTGDTFSLFKALYEKNPAPFFAYINAYDHQIVSTSPERFLLQKGQQVETRPIKGTRPRGKTPHEDRKLGQELKQSKKDDAELSMIVDLLRNDIGKVCRVGSVRVAEHKRLEAYQNVYHLVSIVEGELDKGCGSIDLIKATFPGGSITGCPKIRTMEIIDELEPDRRHIYTGSIGYISFHNTMDLSIAIRTATIYEGKIFFSVGGGIVFDSDPLDEYEETIHKGRTLMEAFMGKESVSAPENYVWMNGIMTPLDQAFISVADLGFQYGYGFFETIKVDKRVPKHLQAHISRFYNTWEQLFYEKPPDLTWDVIIDQVINQNRLNDEIAAVKIIATKGDRETPPYNYTMIVTARPYTHRLKDNTKRGLDLAVYPEPRQTNLADHKTLNYLYYYLAGKWAKAQQADEALILNPDRTISETNTANILLLKNNLVIKPLSSHVLPGVMENVVCEVLSRWGYQMENKSVEIADLFEFDHVIITNALLGAVPVLSIDGKKLPEPSDLCEKINEIV